MMTYGGALNALRAGLAGVGVLAAAHPCQAELTTAAFWCDVQHFSEPNIAPNKVLISIEPGKMSVVVVVTPPYAYSYVLVSDSKAGVVGASTERLFYLPEPGVTGSMILIDRLTGALRWIEARADSQPSVVGKGLCADAH